MQEVWPIIAERAVESFGVKPGERISLRDHAGRADVFDAFAAAIDAAGAFAVIDNLTPARARRLLETLSAERITGLLSARAAAIAGIDRILVLTGGGLNLAELPKESLQAWSSGLHAISEAEERLRIPFRIVAVPTADRAAQTGRSFEELEAAVIAALSVSNTCIERRAAEVLTQIAGSTLLTLRTGSSHVLTLRLVPGRRWMTNAGIIDDSVGHSATVFNLPCGAVYTTVCEEATEGRLFLRRLLSASDVILRFHAGRVVDIEATDGASSLTEVFERHGPDSRRIGHLGIGLNPKLQTPLGWTLVDEHVAGAVFISFGENRYLGGANASSLNVDAICFGSTLEVDGRSVVRAGIL